jgi:hypothetical protein
VKIKPIALIGLPLDFAKFWCALESRPRRADAGFASSKPDSCTLLSQPFGVSLSSLRAQLALESF